MRENGISSFADPFMERSEVRFKEGYNIGETEF